MQTNRSHAGALIVGTIFIAAGLMALAGQFWRLWDWGFFWPFPIIVFGALFFLGMIVGGRQSAALAIPGSIISGIGLVLLFQNITGHWESMSYFWALIIMFVGTGIYIMGWYGGDASQRQSGWGVMKVGFILFVIFGTLFELLLFSSANLVFPVLLILLGLYLVFSRTGLFNRRKIEEPSDPTLPPAS